MTMSMFEFWMTLGIFGAGLVLLIVLINIRHSGKVRNEILRSEAKKSKRVSNSQPVVDPFKPEPGDSMVWLVMGKCPADLSPHYQGGLDKDKAGKLMDDWNDLGYIDVQLIRQS